MQEHTHFILFFNVTSYSILLLVCMQVTPASESQCAVQMLNGMHARNMVV